VTTSNLLALNMEVVHEMTEYKRAQWEPM